MLDRSLTRLARSAGVVTRYRDLDGNEVSASPEALVAVLQALGVDISGPEDAPRAVDRLHASEANRVAPVCAVLWDDGPDGVTLCLPETLSSRGFTTALTLESGQTREWSPSGRTLIRRRSGRRSGSSDRHTVVRLPLPSLPHGYHRFSVELDGVTHDTLLLRAPNRAFHDPSRGRRWGLFAPIYALHSRRSDNMGSYEELGRLLDLVRSYEGGFVATLPFLASFPGESSPYSPLSRLFWNEMYLGADHPVEVAGSGPDLIDYRALASHRMPALRKNAERAFRDHPDELQEFSDQSPSLVDYARFRSALERLGPKWTDWPRAARRGELGSADVDERDVRLHVYAQKLAHERLEAMSGAAGGLFLDLPIGVHRHGYDTWREQSLFAPGVDVGAPPDGAFPDGQNWSFPPVLPQASRAQHHLYLRQVYRHHMRHAGVLRLDHVMGLHRQFWIPSGAHVGQGVYVRYPSTELYAILHIESHRARCELVGENLGIVPDSVNEALRRRGWRGLHVHQLTPNAEIREDVVASLNTHDTPPFAATDGADEASLQEALATLMRSEAGLVSVNIEDLWLEHHRQNIPGTTDETHPNWRRPLRFDTDELEAQIGPWLRTFSR